MTSHSWTFLAVCAAVLITSGARADWFTEVESGAAINSLNDVRIPGDSGTRFSLTRDLSVDPVPYVRIRLGTTVARRHTVFALYAPLRFLAHGTVDRTISFAGETFPANTPLRASYTFNSYRLTYRYRLVDSKDVEFDFGATAKVRDAAITLDGPTYAEKTDVGFVPLLSFRVAYHMSPSWDLLLDGDALAAPQGRAEDALLAGCLRLSDHSRVIGGYRILEGGADNDEVYTFALIHYIVLGLSVTL